MGVLCGGCGLVIPPGRKFCDSCKKYIVKCDNCGVDFHERFIYEWHSWKRRNMQWVCARCLAKLREESEFVNQQVAAFNNAMQGKVAYGATDIRRIFGDVAPTAITGFVQKAKMERVIRLDPETGIIRVNDPTSQERDELSRRFGNWLRFGSPWRPGEEP